MEKNDKTTIQIKKTDLEIIKEWKAESGYENYGDAIVCAIARVRDKPGLVNKIYLTRMMEELSVIVGELEELIQ